KLHRPFASAVARIKLAGKIVINMAIKKVKRKTSENHTGRKSARFERNFLFLSENIVYRSISSHKSLGK
ncbi:PIPO, partial [Wild potato mosaic virus]|uniref:PIPO n=1 Tax=Wild potato mosaic virus TaxID=187977 RepID=UPI0002656655